MICSASLALLITPGSDDVAACCASARTDGANTALAAANRKNSRRLVIISLALPRAAKRDDTAGAIRKRVRRARRSGGEFVGDGVPESRTVRADADKSPLAQHAA